MTTTGTGSSNLNYPGSAAGPYNLRASTSAAASSSASVAGNIALTQPYPNPIEKRTKITHTERSILGKAREVLPKDDVFFRLVELERQIDDKILRRQVQIADSTFRSNKIKRPVKIYLSNSWVESETGGGNGTTATEDDKEMQVDQEQGNFDLPNWILRIEGRIEGQQIGGKGSRGAAAAALLSQHQPKKFSNFIKSVLVESVDAGGNAERVIEWVKNPMAAETDGFEVKRPAANSTDSVQLRIHIQMDFSPEKYRLSADLASLLNIQLVAKPAIIVALWQYIKIHKLQESDEKKIINNDEALQKLFGVQKMSFSDIPVLMEPHLLPPEPIVIDYVIKPDMEMSISPVVYEVDVDVDDVSKPPRNILSNTHLRDISFHDVRLKELLDNLRLSLQTQRMLQHFSANPVDTCQRLLSQATRDYETVVGDVPVSLGELNHSQFYQSEQMEQAIGDFFATIPRYMNF